MSASQLESELARMRPIVEEITGLPSRWNGNVTLMTADEMILLFGKRVYALKVWSCGIVVDVDLTADPIRWRTLLHELIHSVSVDTSETYYRRFRGWEEGVVEQVQRLIRPLVLTRIGEAIHEQLFFEAEDEWVYNNYINALEELRTYLEAEPLPFYLHLLRTPLPNRLAETRSLSEDAAYHRLFALNVGKLR